MGYAISNGHLDVVKHLHSIGKNCTSNCRCKHNHLQIIKYFHSIGSDHINKALGNACLAGHLEIVKYLHSIGEYMMLVYITVLI